MTTGVWQDVRTGLKSLKKDVLVSVLAALSLALAIGGNATVFGFVSALIFRPLPYPDSDRIVLIGEREASSPPAVTASVANLIDWQERNRTFSRLAGFRPAPLSLGDGQRPEPVTAGQVSPGFFELLGTDPLRGRTFQSRDARLGAERVVLLGHQFWQERFSAGVDPTGQTLTLNREQHEVIGVLPEGFEFFNPQVELWTPMVMEMSSASRDNRDAIVVGRLRPGVTMDRAREDLSAVHNRLGEEFPEANRGFVVDALNMEHEIPDRAGRTMLVLLQGAVVFVLLIACLNIANLLLARSQERRHEIALRCALGAGRLRILRQLLIESLVLAFLGGIAGAVFGVVGLRLIARSFEALVPSYWVPSVDASVMLVTAGLTAAAGLLFGISPALMSMKVNLSESVKQSGRGSSVRRRWVSRALVVAEISLSLVLLAGGSALVESLLSLRNADPGFAAKNLLTVSLALPNDESADYGSLLERLSERAQSVPGVDRATLTSALPQNAFVTSQAFRVEGQHGADEQTLPRAVTVFTGPEYLDTLEFPIIAGRFTAPSDRADTAPVAIISQTIAQRFFPDGDALSGRIRVADVSRRIVGVVGDVRQSLLNRGLSADGAIYVPIAQASLPSPFLLVRCAVAPESIAGTLRNELLDVDPRISVGQIQPLDELISQYFVGTNAFQLILSGFGVLALFLAMIGTYGVLAYNVAQRSKEFGIRLAMGATPYGIVKMVTRQGMLLAVAGLLIGIPGVIGIMRLINGIIVYAEPARMSTIVAVFITLFFASLLASWLPARRAASLNPINVLRRD